VIINGSRDYEEAQEKWIHKAAKSLIKGGHLFLTFELYDNPQKHFTCAPSEEYLADPESIDMNNAKVDIFGIRNRSINGGYQYDVDTQMAHGIYRRIKIYPPNCEKRITDEPWAQRILTLEQVHKWLADSRLEIEHEYGGYHKEPIKENEINTIVIWAKKLSE